MSPALAAFVGATLVAAALAQMPGGACDLPGSMSRRQSGREALSARRYDEAAREFQAAFAACPSEHALLVELSQAYSLARQHEQAIQAAQQFIEREPASAAGRVALGNAYFLARRIQDGLRQAEQALRLDPTQAAALKLKANSEYLLGNTDAAISTFLSLLDAHPEDEDGAYMLGRIYYQDARIDYAIGQFQRVLKINPRSYKAYDNLGLCYQARGDIDLAIRYFLTAIKLVEKDHPEYEWPYANLASLLIDKGDAEKAFAAASKAAGRNPLSARNFYLGAKALVKLGKTDLARNWLERSVSIDPDYPDALYLLARVYTQLGQEQKAKETLEKFQKAKAKAPRQRR